MKQYNSSEVKCQIRIQRSNNRKQNVIGYKWLRNYGSRSIHAIEAAIFGNFKSCIGQIITGCKALKALQDVKWKLTIYISWRADSYYLYYLTYILYMQYVTYIYKCIKYVILCIWLSLSIKRWSYPYTIKKIY